MIYNSQTFSDTRGTPLHALRATPPRLGLWPRHPPPTAPTITLITPETLFCKEFSSS